MRENKTSNFYRHLFKVAFIRGSEPIAECGPAVWFPHKHLGVDCNNKPGFKGICQEFSVHLLLKTPGWWRGLKNWLMQLICGLGCIRWNIFLSVFQKVLWGRLLVGGRKRKRRLRKVYTTWQRREGIPEFGFLNTTVAAIFLRASSWLDGWWRGWRGSRWL